MNLIELNEKEFYDFAIKNEYISFYQSKEWAKVKSFNGWKNFFVGLISSDKKILGATMLLAKSTIIGKSIFYAPRGFLIDYNNHELLRDFTKEIKLFVKKNNGIFIKIDPLIIYKQRDINGDIVKDGIDSSNIVKKLESFGYKHYGFSISSHVGLQPRWVFVLPLENKSIDDINNGFNSRTKRSIKKCLNHGVIVEKIDNSELSVFKSIMEHTSSRRGFIDRPFSYYQRLVDCLGDKCKIYIAYLDIELSLKQCSDEISLQKIKLNELDKNKESKKYEDNKSKCEKSIEDRTKEIEKLTVFKEKYGNKIPLGGGLFLHYANEFTYLFGGSYQEFMEYPSQYLVQFTAIKEAVNTNCHTYNFYGIDGHLKEDGEMHGVYEFKKGFGGEVREYIGEFDLVVNKFYYSVYKVSFFCYHTVKRVISKIKK